MLLIKSANVLFEILNARFENDEFLKSKNTAEYEKLVKQIKLFKLKLPNSDDAIAKKIKFFSDIETCKFIYSEIHDRILSEDFLSFSSSTTKETAKTINNLEENYLIFELNQPDPNSIFNSKDIKWISKNFKEFVTLTFAKCSNLLNVYSQFNKNEIQSQQFNIIKKPVKNNIILCFDHKREITPLVKCKSNAIITTAIYNTHYILDKNIMLKSGITDLLGITKKYIELTKTINVSYENISNKGKSMSSIIHFDEKCYNIVSPTNAPQVPVGSAEGYNFYFNEELEKHIGHPIIEPQSNLEKVNIKGKIGELISHLAGKHGSKGFKTAFRDIVLSRFENIIDKSVRDEINATLSYETFVFYSKTTNVTDILGYLKLYFSDENIMSKLYDKIKVINRKNI